MSIDDRIRTGLSRNSAVPSPPVEHLLDRVTRTHRRRSGFRLVMAAAAVALLGLVPLAVVQALTGRTTEPTRPGSPGLLGTYRVLVPEDTAVPRMRGAWRVTFTADGRVAVAAPSTFGRTGGSGATYVIRADTLTTNVFVDQPGCQLTSPAVGTYRVLVTASGPRFTELDDSCQVRAALFGASWELLP